MKAAGGRYGWRDHRIGGGRREMGRKMVFPSLFRASSSLPWPSCQGHPRTRSFRGRRDDAFKTVSSVYLDTAESWFADSSEEELPSKSLPAAEEDGGGESSAEAVVRALMQSVRGGGRRLFFEPGPGATSSIAEEAEAAGDYFPFEGSVVVMEVESEDPGEDFRLSMEEMVGAHGVRDWDRLEELLGWYLRLTGRPPTASSSAPSSTCCWSSLPSLLRRPSVNGEMPSNIRSDRLNF